jgi:hypothetical protein
VGEESFETEVSVAAGSAAASRRLDLGQRRGHLLALGTSLLSLVSLAAANDLDLRDSAFGRETAATTRLRKARQRCLRQRWQWQAGWTTTPRHDTTRAQVRQGVELSSASQNKNVKLLGRRARRVREWCERSRICVCACECVRVVRVCVCECTIRLPGC